MSIPPVVDFSKLPSSEKEKYYNFLVNNNVTFTEGANDYIAKIKIFNKG
jgi:hypothetical protein